MLSSHPLTVAIRVECPPGACVCRRAELLSDPGADWRVLQLTREEEKRLIGRLEKISSLPDLRHMQERLSTQLDIQVTVTPGPNEVRSMRGIVIQVSEKTGLCRKTRQAIPAAIRRCLELRPEIAFALLHEGDLFGAMP